MENLETKADGIRIGARKNCPLVGRLRLYVNYLFIGEAPMEMFH